MRVGRVVIGKECRELSQVSGWYRRHDVWQAIAHTSRFHLVGADVDQLLDLFGLDVLAGPGLLPVRLGRRCRLVGGIGCLCSTRGILGPENLLEEGHGGSQFGGSAVVPGGICCWRPLRSRGVLRLRSVGEAG